MSVMPSFVGHSGCLLQLRGPCVLRKISATPEYGVRLRNQVHKQRAMKAFLDLPGVHIPAVLDEGENDDGSYWADMELYVARNVSDFLITSDPKGLSRLARLLLDVVEALEGASQSGFLPRERVRSKARNIHREIENLRRNPEKCDLLPSQTRMECYLDFLENVLPECLELRLGASHGDLTLTNVLIREDASEIALVDFLDGFLEAPLLDMAKLRQDTRHGWSMVQHALGSDATRLRMALKHLDGLLEAAFESRAEYRQGYQAFQFLNHLRILPYLRDETIAHHVLGVLDSLMESESNHRSTS